MLLKDIAIITIVVGNLQAVENAWESSLGYQPVASGEITEALADLWAAPAMLGQAFTIMAPADDDRVYIRIVEDVVPEDYAPMTSWGWNAVELKVRDTDAVAGFLEDSPFTIVGGPRDLWPGEGSPRVMQVRGPGQETLYLTRPAGADASDGAGDISVGRSFIVVVGGDSVDAMREFYREQMAIPVGEPEPYPITVISKANDLPLETTYPLAIAPLQSGALIEIDGYPQGTRKRSVVPGHIPPGISMVGFSTDAAELPDLEWRSLPRQIKEFPYDGRTAGLVIGAAGEWIELISAQELAEPGD